MSWLLIIILIIFILSVAQGIRKGLIRTIVSTFFLVFVMAISIWLSPYIENLLKAHTGLPSYINEQCTSFVRKELGGEKENQDASKNTAGMNEDQNAFESEQIEKLPIPSSLKQKLIDNNTGEVYQSLLANTFGEYLAKYLSGVILYIIAFMLSFLVAVIIIQIIMKAVDVVTALPLIGLANRLGGGAAGVLRALLWIWVFFAVLTIFGSTSLGSLCMNEISGNMILSYLYKRNMLMELIMDLFGKYKI